MRNGLLIGLLAASGVIAAFASPVLAQARAAWRQGVWADDSFFPLCVWLQNPSRAAQYKQAGINTYIGLWKGPTGKQLEQLRDAGMHVICDQNEVGLKHKDDQTIIGWMHGDEPDNAQRIPGEQGYGPPIKPQKIIDDYNALRRNDPSRPVILNLGQGVAWDGWHGRGVRTNHPEDYREYAKGCDIVSFDIYPVVHSKDEIRGNLWYVPYGVERLVKWTDGSKPVWACLECTHIGNPPLKADPHQMRAEAWMAIIHGARGLIWFVHQFKPTFSEAAVLDDPANLAAMTALNRQITTLAKVINSAGVDGAVTVASSNQQCPVAITVRKHDGAMYIFAAAMRDQKTTATFTLTGGGPGGKADVIDEDRTRRVADGKFTDTFNGYEVHLYRLAP